MSILEALVFVAGQLRATGLSASTEVVSDTTGFVRSKLGVLRVEVTVDGSIVTSPVGG